MKKHLLTAILFVLSVIAFAEDFYVVKVNGTIKVNGALAKPGLKISTGQKVVFVTSGANAVVISPKRGRLVLKNKAGAKQSEFDLTVAALTNPPHGQLSTRAGGLVNKLDLQKHFSKETYCVIDSSEVEISNVAFPMNDSKFFYLEYNYRGDTIPKMLDFKKGSGSNNLVLNPKKIFTVDGNKIKSTLCDNFTLYYYNDASGVSEALSSVNFKIIDGSELKTETDILVNMLKASKKKPDEIKKEVGSYIKDSYGSVSKANFENWYSKNYK